MGYKEFYGIQIDFNHNVWIVVDETLIVLNEQLEEIKKFKFEESNAFNKVTEPAKNHKTIMMYPDRQYLLWFRNNAELYKINVKEQKIVRSFRNFLEIPEIECI